MVGTYCTCAYKISGIPYMIKIGLTAVVLTYTKTVKSSVAPKIILFYMAYNVVIIIQCSSEKRKHCYSFTPFPLVMKRCSF